MNGQIFRSNVGESRVDFKARIKELCKRQGWSRKGGIQDTWHGTFKVKLIMPSDRKRKKLRRRNAKTA